jgi:hypothetical protein
MTLNIFFLFNFKSGFFSYNMDCVSCMISKGQGISSREIKGQGAFSIKIGHFI